MGNDMHQKLETYKQRTISIWVYISDKSKYENSRVFDYCDFEFHFKDTGNNGSKGNNNRSNEIRCQRHISKPFEKLDVENRR